MFPFVAGGGLYHLAPAAELLARVLANIAHLHIINKTIASPALHETKFLIHIISFNKGSCLPLLLQHHSSKSVVCLLNLS